VYSDNWITFRLDVLKNYNFKQLQQLQCDRPSFDIPDDGPNEAETCRKLVLS
jgi:hypothetical protein